MLALSTEAAPDASLETLAVACGARGLDGVEVALAPGQDPDQLVALVRAANVRVVALRVARVDMAAAPALARAAAALGVPVSVPPRGVDPAALGGIVAPFVRANARLLLGHPTELDEALATLGAILAVDAPSVLGLAWEIEPSAGTLKTASATLLAVRELLGVVRLHGGGPEQRDQDGRRVGPLLSELALSGYAGPTVLCPSGPEALPRWAKWLDSRGSSGCGHAASAREILLDIREVEPRDRLETILGAYHTLVPGATLNLTVDHDPICMYYTLEATEPERSFTFKVIEHGPEVWRAEVTKR